MESNPVNGYEVECSNNTSLAQSVVTRILKRKEISVNGEREEYYYEVSGYGNARFREDFLEEKVLVTVVYGTSLLFTLQKLLILPMKRKLSVLLKLNCRIL